jgi:hypothetical protein
MMKNLDEILRRFLRMTSYEIINPCTSYCRQMGDYLSEPPVSPPYVGGLNKYLGDTPKPPAGELLSCISLIFRQDR